MLTAYQDGHPWFCPVSKYSLFSALVLTLISPVMIDPQYFPNASGT